MPNKIPPQVREYFRVIGAKGGAAGKGTELRRELSKRAANMRWRKQHPKPKRVDPQTRSTQKSPKQNAVWAERYNEIARATRAGEIKRANQKHCEDCGAPAIHRHHDNYSEPLKVRWLCAKCHKARHRKNKSKILLDSRSAPVTEGACST